MLIIGSNAQYAVTTTPTTPDVTTVPEFDGLGCFHCDAPNMTVCEEIGKLKKCPENAQSCMIEIRKRNGEMESVCMGCKSPEACADNKSQNFKGKWADRQCKPWKWYKNGPSVCRQCCATADGEDCAKDFANQNDGEGPLKVTEWKADIMSSN